MLGSSQLTISPKRRRALASRGKLTNALWEERAAGLNLTNKS
jgi:hypothetical protein